MCFNVNTHHVNTARQYRTLKILNSNLGVFLAVIVFHLPPLPTRQLACSLFSAMAHANQDFLAEIDFVGMFIDDPQTPEPVPQALRQPPLAPSRPPHAVLAPAAAAAAAAPPVEYDFMPVPVLHRRQLIFETPDNDDYEDMDMDVDL
jgi:hypothetical protein